MSLLNLPFTLAEYEARLAKVRAAGTVSRSRITSKRTSV